MSSSCTPSSMPSVVEVFGPHRSKRPLPAPPVPSTPVCQWFNPSSLRRLLHRITAPTLPMHPLPNRMAPILKAPLLSPTLPIHSRLPLKAKVLPRSNTTPILSRLLLKALLPSSTAPTHSKLLKVPPPVLPLRASRTTTLLLPTLLSNMLTTLATLPVQLATTPPLSHRSRIIARTLLMVPRPRSHCLVGIKDNRPHSNSHPNIPCLCEDLFITQVMFEGMALMSRGLCGVSSTKFPRCLCYIVRKLRLCYDTRHLPCQIQYALPIVFLFVSRKRQPRLSSFEVGAKARWVDVHISGG